MNERKKRMVKVMSLSINHNPQLNSSRLLIQDVLPGEDDVNTSHNTLNNSSAGNLSLFPHICVIQIVNKI